jgi:hypothetical protein
MLMINNHFARFRLPGNLLNTKKCAPYFRGNTQFPIYFLLHGSKIKFSFSGKKMFQKLYKKNDPVQPDYEDRLLALRLKMSFFLIPFNTLSPNGQSSIQFFSIC